MISYKTILEDKEIVSQYQKVDDQNKYPFIHGLQHIKNVVEIMKKLAKALQIPDNDTQNLLIACVLHDIGQVDGRERHGKKGRKFARQYLDGKINENDLENILTAIEKHDQNVDLDKLSLFTNLVCFADKMDFAKNRFEENYREKFDYIVYENVLDVDFEFNTNNFILRIKTGGKINKNDLLNEKIFFHKVIAATHALADKLGVMPLICVDDEHL
jgi:HD-GYP domain-containing protein (c-di-GMP phosphodiesterase class II)